jgi:WXG100 family type VII secretion target
MVMAETVACGQPPTPTGDLRHDRRVIHLDQARFDLTLRTLRDGAERLAADRDRAAYDVDSLLRTGWSGRAADAFAAAWDDWLAGAREVLDSLDAMTGAMAATRADLQITDGGVAATGTSLRERLG